MSLYFEVLIGAIVFNALHVMVTGEPFMITLPDLRFNNPSMAFMAVDFPAPFGPSIETISP